MLLVITGSMFLYAKRKYQQADFGASFGTKSTIAMNKLAQMQELFITCAPICNADATFMQAIVFPEVMRYNSLKDGIEAESLRTLYVQLGNEYADFSIGIFQMKPSFAEQVEEKAEHLLSPAIKKELQLQYDSDDTEEIRRQRVERLQDAEWQMIYLTAFTALCNQKYANKKFENNLEKMQWYATVYNAGFDRTDAYISKKIKEEHFYLQQDMPGKTFRYAAIAGWYFTAEK
ncbi:MAG: hypothetical protein EOO03_05800 [Chitinophagaceae bacterium]|nr:MAG: hypothetical protein EOO03_05800 [Chitinophagaceae bacterium]